VDAAHGAGLRSQWVEISFADGGTEGKDRDGTEGCSGEGVEGVLLGWCGR
jgi:hypothetical protein